MYSINEDQMDGWMMGMIPSRGRDFSLRHYVETGSGAYPASCPIGTGGKAARV
jgi:hypothetical protein